MTSITVPSQPLSSVSTNSGDPFKDLEGQFVVDSAGNLFWLELSYDNITGATNYAYFDQPNGTISTPVGGVSPVQDSNIQILKRCDDINGDGSSIVDFYRVNVYDESGLIVSSVPQTASGASYAVQGVERECASKQETISSFDSIETSDFNIPSGFVHGSIMVITGSCTVNGATYNAGEGLSLPPMSYGETDRRYPQYSIASVTGQVRINYHV